MAARRAGLPLWRLLDDSGTGVGLVRVYASGIGPQDVVDLALAKQAQGYAAFKLKVGFAADVDRRNLADLRAALGPQAEIMIDAYQAWSPGDVVTRIAALADLEPLWVEEPIAADEDAAHWRQLANECGLALAAGENLRGESAFTQAIDAGYLRYRCRQIGRSWRLSRSRAPCAGTRRDFLSALVGRRYRAGGLDAIARRDCQGRVPRG